MRTFFVVLVSLFLLSFVLGQVSSSTETRFFIEAESDDMNPSSVNDNALNGEEGSDTFTLFLIAVLIIIVIYIAYRLSKGKGEKKGVSAATKVDRDTKKVKKKGKRK